MTAIASLPGDLRLEAARIAFALIRFEEAAAQPYRASTPPGMLAIGTEAYLFTPSWRRIPRHEVELFLAGLPSPALLSPTTTRGMVALTLLHELSGERRRWAEKTLSNFTAGFDELTVQFGLSPESRILLEFDEESHVFSFRGTRLWTQQFGVQVGWSMISLENDPRAQARLMLRRSTGERSWGDSCPVPYMQPPHTHEPAAI
jgi:hypothetical protein